MEEEQKRGDTTKVHFNARATLHLPVSERSLLQKCKIAFAFAFQTNIGGRQMLTYNLYLSFGSTEHDPGATHWAYLHHVWIKHDPKQTDSYNISTISHNISTTYLTISLQYLTISLQYLTINNISSSTEVDLRATDWACDTKSELNTIQNKQVATISVLRHNFIQTHTTHHDSLPPGAPAI